MALPNIFGTIATGAQEPGSALDANFNAVALMGLTYCTASGTNAIVLTPAASPGQPPVSAYANQQRFAFVAANSSTGAVTIQVSALSALPVYGTGSGTQIGAGYIIAGNAYDVQFLTALNGGLGGFVLMPSHPGMSLGAAVNDNALAGAIGEFISSTVLIGSAVSVSSAVSANVTSISLTSGDWDVFGSVVTNATGGTTTSNFAAGISTTSATLPTAPNGGYAQMQVSVVANGTLALSVGTSRLSLSTTTTVFLVGLASFAVSTMSLYGFIGARRRR